MQHLLVMNIQRRVWSTIRI